MITLIDGDSIIHMVAYNHRNDDPDPGTIYQVQASVDSFIQMILNMSRADKYLGAIGNPERKCFRDYTYKYRVYKGERPIDPEHMVKWRQHITDHMCRKYGFIWADNLEADDIIAMCAEYASSIDAEFVIASPDKDMRQIVGTHMNYKKEIPEFTNVSFNQAHYNLWLQILIGDSGDNIAGIPKIGPVKATTLLNGVEFIVEYGMVVRQAYFNYFGPHYGPIIFQETKDAIELMNSKHNFYSYYKEERYRFTNSIKPFGQSSKGIFE